VNRVLGVLAALALLLGGAGLLALYALLATGRIGHVDKPADAAVLAGAGAIVALGGALALLGQLRWRRRALVDGVRLPPLWFSFAVFAGAIAAGAYATRSTRYYALDPALAIVAVCAFYLLVERLATRWGPRQRGAARAMFGPTAWGTSGAILIALLLQVAFFGACVGAVYLGLYASDHEVARAAWRAGIADKIDHAGGEIAQTWTIAIAALALYALVAPLTEELAKLLGVLLVMRRNANSRYVVFIAGVSAGLGFATLETMLYGLAAADKWPLVVGVRAPVMLIHVTGASLSALGWQMQRTRGGFALLWHYLTAVLLHGAWNGLTVALLIASARSHDSARLDPATTLAELAVLAIMAL
jgi:hypothetical protein